MKYFFWVDCECPGQHPDIVEEKGRSLEEARAKVSKAFREKHGERCDPTIAPLNTKEGVQKEMK